MMKYKDKEKLKRARVFFKNYIAIRTKSKYFRERNHLNLYEDELVALEIYVNTPIFSMNIGIFGSKKLSSYHLFDPDPNYMNSVGDIFLKLFMESKDLRELAYKIKDTFLDDVTRFNFREDKNYSYYDIVSDEDKGE